MKSNDEDILDLTEDMIEDLKEIFQETALQILHCKQFLHFPCRMTFSAKHTVPIPLSGHSNIRNVELLAKTEGEPHHIQSKTHPGCSLCHLNRDSGTLLRFQGPGRRGEELRDAGLHRLALR